MSRAERWIAYLSRALEISWALYLIVFASDAGLPLVPLLVTAWGAVGLLGIWLGRSLLRLFLLRRRRESTTSARALLLEPLAIVALAGAVFTGIAFEGRFLLSRHALDRYVREVKPSGRKGSRASARVGLFYIRETERLPGGTVRFITSVCMFDDCGLAYSPSGEPPRIGEDIYHHLSGPWWHWWRSW